MTSTRNETEIFEDLAKLARQPGYVHALAYVCNRDNFVAYQREMKAGDLQHLFGHDRLIRTEIATLLGLLVKGTVDFTEPSHDVRDAYVDRTERLMSELHESLSRPMLQSIINASESRGTKPTWSGEVMREPIFYGAEGAYTFQYRDLAVEKYTSDDVWLTNNKGFTIRQGKTLAKAMCQLIDEKATALFVEHKRTGAAPTSWLYAHEITASEISSKTKIDRKVVDAFLSSFTLATDNSGFNALGDFNEVCAFPLIPTERGSVLLFQHYGISESLYDSPFYWMISDSAYKDVASRNRGEFTESFAARRLAAVFGERNVYRNALVRQTKGTLTGEIDVLVSFGDRLIIVQAKSKKLTLEARRGNDRQLQKDFAAAVQDSYDQGWICAESIAAGTDKLEDAAGNEIQLSHPPKEIFIFNLVSEHFPALAFQVSQYLSYKTTEQIRAPFVMDVFLLDALAEMLDKPLRFLHYLQLRIESIKRLSLSHELVALGFHLKRNLWLEPDFDFVMLEDDVAADLDLSMMVRRENIPGPYTPEGILTRMSGTRFDRLVSQIEKSSQPATIALGLQLLTLSEDTCRNIDHGLDVILSGLRKDGRRHDFTIGGDYGGITFHANPLATQEAQHTLAWHCERRKYAQKSTNWYGVSFDVNCRIQFGVALEYPWTRSEDLESATRSMKSASPADSILRAMASQNRKTGRNDLCPCGSKKKYKKCCLAVVVQT